MFIAIKNKKVISIHEIEWKCRKNAKGLTKPEYWTWLETVTTEDESGVKTYDFSGEDYEIVETEVDVQGFNQSGHITSAIGEGISYHLKWNASKKEVVKDDDAKTAWELSVQWKRIRAERNRLIAETDWMMLSDTGTVSAAWKNYRKALREIPQSQDSAKTFADIKWPDKPSS